MKASKILLVVSFLASCESRSPEVVPPDSPPPLLDASFVADVGVGPEANDLPDFSKVLGSFETKYQAGGNRGKNIERAASFFRDGVVIAAGEILSFNKIVGARDEKNGFLKAPVIFNGEMTDGDGGGTCQVSSTLHAAALMAGVKIVTRRPHSRPSAYIPMGLDATVVWPDVDLKLKNETTLPVMVVMMTSVNPKNKSAGVIHVEFRGGCDPVPKPVYTFKSEPTGETFERRWKVPDGGAPPGYIKKAQKGLDGQTVYSTLKITSEDAETVLRWKSIYPPTDEVWEVASDWTPDAGMPWEYDAGSDGGRDAGRD